MTRATTPAIGRKALSLAAAAALLATGAVVAPGVLPALPTASAQAADAGPAIPVEIRQTGWGFEPVVAVEIGGATVHLMLDTGSDGLWLNDDTFAGMTTPPVGTGIPMTLDYNPGDITGQLAMTPVTIGTFTTPEPIGIFAAESCTFDCHFGDLQLDGILGIKQGMITLESGGVAYHYYSPLMQLGGDAAKGHTLRLGENAGTLTLGKPADRSGMVLQAGTTPESYPEGRTVYQSTFPLCWSIDQQQNCASTIVDSGEFLGELMGSQFDPYSTPLEHPEILPGTQVEQYATIDAGTVYSFSQGPDDAPFVSQVAALDGPHSVGLYRTLTPGAGDYMNTGNGFFVGRSMGFDNETGELVIGDSESAPAAPPSVSAEAVEEGVDVHWTASESPGDAPLDSYVVSVLRENGKVVSRVTVGVDARSHRLDLAGEHGAFRVEVAAANRFGVSPFTAAPGTYTPLKKADPAKPDRKDDGSRLADTGSPVSVTLPVAAAAALALLAGAALRRRAQARH